MITFFGDNSDDYGNGGSGDDDYRINNKSLHLMSSSVCPLHPQG